MIVAEGGQFPKTVSSLRKVPGIGDYTAGAIASIAFKEVSIFCRYGFNQQVKEHCIRKKKIYFRQFQWWTEMSFG